MYSAYTPFGTQTHHTLNVRRNVTKSPTVRHSLNQTKMKTNLSVPVILLAKINSLLTQKQLLSFQTKLNVVMVSLILMLSITFSYAQNPGSIQKLD